MITLRQLQIFVAVVRAGSFRRCAEQLGMSQVSVSEQVRALEQRLGARLFERVAGGSPVITEKGRSAHARIVDILGSVDELLAEMKGGMIGGARQLKVGMHSFLTRDLQPVLRSFSQSHPLVDVMLDSEAHTQERLLDMVAERTLDLAYFFSLDAAVGTRLVRHEPLSIVVAEHHPLASAPIVNIEDLAKIPALQLNRGNPLRIAVDRAFSAVGIGDRCIGVETSDFGMILGSVQRGQGYACLFDATWPKPTNLPGLRKVMLDRPLPPLEIRCATRRGTANDPVLSAFCEAVEECWAVSAAELQSGI